VKAKLLAPAKINLYLKVLAKRADGYHDIESLVVPVSLCDLVCVERVGEGIEVLCNHPDCPDGEENLVYRAVEWFFEVSGRSDGVRVSIDKRIPVGAGLGGGSSDAAAVIKALELLFDFKLDSSQRALAAFDVGADVPSFFVSGAKVIRGIGERVEPVGYDGHRWFVLVNPRFQVSTASVYERFSLSLTRQKSENKIKVKGASGRNDLRDTVVELYPEVGEVMKGMEGLGFDPCVSGSGPTCFAPLESLEQVGEVLSFAKRRGCKAYVVHYI